MEKSWKGWLPRIYDCSRKQTGCADAFERGKTDSECTVAWCGGFSRRLCPFHGHATPDFEAAFVCSIGPLPAWHVERSRKSPKWLLVFAPAISSLLRIGNVPRSMERLKIRSKLDNLAVHVFFILYLFEFVVNYREIDSRKYRRQLTG